MALALFDGRTLEARILARRYPQRSCFAHGDTGAVRDVDAIPDFYRGCSGERVSQLLELEGFETTGAGTVDVIDYPC